MGTITEQELIELRDWLNNPKNQSRLESHVRDYHDLNLATLKNDVDKAYKKVVDHIDRDERPVKKLIPNWGKYAAAVIFLFGIAFMYQQSFFSSQDEPAIVSRDEPITLQFDTGDIQTIDISQTKQIKDADGKTIGTQKRNQIRYSDDENIKNLVFNTLKVPNGKQFELELSDGTIVHLNAGSSLRYPVHFLPLEPRQVFLSGEAYFEVSKNETRTFVVQVDELGVEVLGTEFNISAYEEDENINVVLIDGSVSLNNKGGLQDNSTKLSPGQRGSFDYMSQHVKVDEVNTLLYTSWMQRHLVFRDLTFDQIITKLERHYNIEIENTNTELGKEVFNASFDDIEIEKVLSFFNDAHKIKYTIKNSKVIIE